MGHEGSLPDRELDGEVRRLLEEQNVIEAVKLCRRNRPWSLKQARDHVGEVASGMGMPLGGGSSGISCSLIILLFMTWAAVMVLVPLLVRRLVEDMAGPLSNGAAAGIIAGTALLLVALSITGVMAWARRSSSPQRK